MNNKKESFLNTYVNNIDMSEAIQSILFFIEKQKKAYVVPINVDVVIKMEKDDYLRRISNEADLTLIDGQPLIWISKLYKRPIKEKISGSDLIPCLCKVASEKNLSVFIIGGKPGVAEKAKHNLEKTYRGIRIVGVYSPMIGFENDINEINNINELITKKSPDILIACFGCPKQEKWIYENYKKYDAIVSICAGATVDFLAGNIKRAPKWVSSIGFEWLFRFFKEPRRLFKRYFVDDMKIFKIAWKYKENE